MCTTWTGEIAVGWPGMGTALDPWIPIFRLVDHWLHATYIAVVFGIDFGSNLLLLEARTDAAHHALIHL